jgi:hypothetical protein
MEFTAAGTIFTDGKLLLAGYQPKKTIPCISGIGGKREGEELYMTTAIRETIEELFGIVDIPSNLIEEINLKIIPQSIEQNGGYIIAIYSFIDLIQILNIVSSYSLPTPLYEVLPISLHELLFNRTYTCEAEISHLVLLPVVSQLTIDNDLLQDISLYNLKLNTLLDSTHVV